MYKVLIADDEDIIRRGLAGMVSQYEGLEVSSLAEDGEIALEQARLTHPDLMLVDINMPFMDGFDLIRTAKAILPDVEIVIVTGYDDFPFAQKALQLGVSDYIVKPVMEEPFFKVLDKTMERLNRKAEANKYLNWLTRQIKQNRPAMVNDFFRSWLQNGMDAFEVKERMQYLDIRLPSPYCVTLLYFQGEPSEAKESDVKDWDTGLLLYGCEHMIREASAPYCEIFTFKPEEGALAIISPVLEPRQSEEWKKKMVLPVEEYFPVKIGLIQRQGTSVSEFPEVVEQTMQERRAHQHYSKVVANAIDLIHRRLSCCEFSLQAAADLLFVNPQHLSRLFHRETGETFGSYLTKQRIKEAMRLLQNQNLKMYEISRRTGYSSQHYFSNAFKRIIGISPAEYRKNMLEWRHTK